MSKALNLEDPLFRVNKVIFFHLTSMFESPFIFTLFLIFSKDDFWIFQNNLTMVDYCLNSYWILVDWLLFPLILSFLIVLLDEMKAFICVLSQTLPHFSLKSEKLFHWPNLLNLLSLELLSNFYLNLSKFTLLKSLLSFFPYFFPWFLFINLILCQV